jgi:MerR family transcriptional regulator, light-induced transcriptional regulator
MKQSYSTKELAEMWDVSESTIKRWADAGMLRCRKTIGGHRKFELEDILEFQNQCDLAKKEAAENGRAECSGELKRLLNESDFQGLVSCYKQAALTGQSVLVSSLITQSNQHGFSLATIGEEIIKPAMQEVGEMWRTGKIRVLDEHLATLSTMEALTDLHGQVAKQASMDHLAVVGCSEGELHQLGSILVRDILEAEGWKVVYLGSHTPLFSFAEAINRFKPELVCISITMMDNLERAVRDYETLRRAALKHETKIIIGGAALKCGEVRARFRGALYLESLHDLLRIVASDEQ